MKAKKTPYMSPLANFAYNTKASEKKRMYKQALEAATKAQLKTIEQAKAC